MTSPLDVSARPVGPRWHLAWIEVALVALVFAAQAAWPAPEPNEPHYLGKAKHFWDPAWAPRDFFFNSADSHLVFYVAFGWLSRVLPLSGFAWCGRIVTWLALAWGWRRLSWAIVPRPGWTILTGFTFLVLNVCCHWAGEWVVGGFEAKGLAYALVLAALAELVVGRWNRAWLLLGAASALHVLVGGWSAVAVACCWLARRDSAPRLREMIAGIIGGSLIALPGLIAALALNLNAEPAAAAAANEIYVFERLKHHLVPQQFPPWLIVRHLLLLAGWLAFDRATQALPQVRRLGGVVFGSLAIELCGLAISLAAAVWPATAASLLRLYWFRLSDAMLPLGVALAGAAATFALSRRRGLAIGGWIAVGLLVAASQRQEFAVARFFRPPARADKPGRVLNAADWRNVCQWAADHTPADALFLTPRLAQTFTWHAGRGQAASWKDIPQDAAAIVEWWRRIKAIYGTRDPSWQGEWYESLAVRSPAALRRLGEQYGATCLVTEATPQLELPLLYANRSYAVYSLNEPSAMGRRQRRQFAVLRGNLLSCPAWRPWNTSSFGKAPTPGPASPNVTTWARRFRAATSRRAGAGRFASGGRTPTG